MRKFKVGDKVRCAGKSEYGDDEAIGCVHKIAKVYDDGACTVGDWVMHPDNLELIKPVKPTRKKLKAKIRELENKIKEHQFEAGTHVVMVKDGDYLKQGCNGNVLQVMDGKLQIKVICWEDISSWEKP